LASNFSNQSSAAVAGLNITLEPVESIIMKGLQGKIQNLTEAKTVWVSSTDKTRALQELFGDVGSDVNEINVTYPYVFLTLSSFGESEGRLHNRRSAMRGLPSVIVDDQKRCFNVKFMAVDFVINFQYVTNSYKQAQRMAALWLFARKNGWFKFDVQYGRTQFGIGIEMDPSVNIPTREADLEDLSEYTVEATMTVQGFMSFPTLVEQQVANQLDIIASLNDGTTLWEFKTQNDNSPVTGSVPPQQL
jgi:hypothetical protein